MSLLRPSKLVLEGFRSFRERAEIVFPKSGTVLINGHHKDGSTGSGTGKSSILNALYFALGCSDLPQTELKNWNSKSLMVELTMTDDINTYVITRSPKLTLVINGVPYQGTSEGAETELERVLKTSNKLITPLTYRPQRSTGKFINQTDAANKEFLSNILNLTEIETANDSFKDELSSLNQKAQILKANIANFKTNLASMSFSLDDYELAQRDCENANAAYSLATAGAVEANKLTQDLSAMDNEQYKLNKVLQEVNTAKQENTSIRNQVQQLDSQIQVLSKNICHTCNREWEKSADLAKTKKDEIARYIDRMKSNLSLIKNAEPLTSPEHQASINNRKAELQSFIAKLKTPIDSALTSKRMADGKLNLLLNIRNTIDQSEKAIAVEELKLKGLDIDLYVLGHVSEITSRTGFLGEIFDEVLMDINLRSNDILAYIPNINTFSLNISSTSTTTTGKVNKKLETSMFKDGRKVSIKALSGGQKTSVELATDLAVGEAIRARSGSLLGWIALDEALDGLDVNTKIATVDIIKQKVKGLIIVVDHSTELRESFDQVIEVQYDGRDSVIVQ